MKRERDNIMDDDEDDDDDDVDENPQSSSRPNRSSSSNFRISPESTCSNHHNINPTTTTTLIPSSSSTNNNHNDINNNNAAIKSTSIHNNNNNNNKEQDRFLPIANVGRIMKKVIPGNGKISKDAKETVQECVSEFISFVTGEASDKCQREKRKTINGDDILWAIMTLGFEDYVNPLKLYLTKYREIEGEKLNLPKQQQRGLQHVDQTPPNNAPVPNYNNSGNNNNNNSVVVYSSSTNLMPQPSYNNNDPPFPLPFSQNPIMQTTPLPQQDHVDDEHW